jgi:hypothetical protein
MNTSYVWRVFPLHCVKVTKNLTLKLTKLDYCSTWNNKKHANTWKKLILERYPKAQLVPVTLKFLNED